MIHPFVPLLTSSNLLTKWGSIIILLLLLLGVIVLFVTPYWKKLVDALTEFSPLQSVLTLLGFVVLMSVGVVSFLHFTEIEGPFHQAFATISLDAAAKSLVSAFIFIFMYIVSLVTAVIIRRITDEKNSFDGHSTAIVIRLFQIFCIFTAVLLVLSVWNVNVGNILLGAGFLSVVVGLTARETLRSSLAGIILMMSQPFKIGDWVEINENKGRVINITMVNTKLRSATGKYIVIPNDSVTNGEITNLSAIGRLQLYVDVGIDYDEDIDKAVETADTALSDLDYIMETPSQTVHPEEFSESEVVLRVYFWVENPSETKCREAKGKVIREISEAYEEEDIKIPFPQKEVSQRQET